MNNNRRKEIARAVAMIADAREILEICRDQEQDYYEKMPEAVQSGVKGEAVEAEIDNLDEQIEALEAVEAALQQGDQP